MDNKGLIEISRYKKGAYVYIEGVEKATTFYYIQDGRVELISQGIKDYSLKDKTLGKGKIFGLIATMAGQKYLESAIALTDLEILVIPKKEFVQAVTKMPSIAFDALTQITSRECELIKELCVLLLHKHDQPDLPRIFDLGEYYSLNGYFESANYAYQKYLHYFPQGDKIQEARDRLKQIATHVKKSDASFRPEENSRSYPQNSIVFIEGEPCDDFFMIQKGQIKLTKISNNSETILAILKPGSFFGEVSMIESKPCPYSAIAFTDCEIIAINRPSFEAMLRAKPQVIANIVSQLCERLWLMYKQIDGALSQDPLARLFNTLLVGVENDKVDPSRSVSHKLSFGIKELIDMAGVKVGEGDDSIRRLSELGRLQVLQEEILISDVSEIQRRSEYYRKKQRLMYQSYRSVGLNL
ncbi:MAG: cyclic nucleotide-binding domain-containing protein [Spirochaetaceae bacterium]|jgi:CRP-like cAMP-binding protein|nr:cyclic nucleotide-binding domain-containing protein [Spirochaetaceae bacterium]